MSSINTGPRLSSMSTSSKRKGKQAINVTFESTDADCEDTQNKIPEQQNDVDDDHSGNRQPLWASSSSAKQGNKQAKPQEQKLSSQSEHGNDDAVMIDIDAETIHPSEMEGSTNGPDHNVENAGQSNTFINFPALKDHRSQATLTQTAKVTIPPHRMTPLKKCWPALYTPLVEELGLRVRVNAPRRRIELKTCKQTKLVGSLTKATSFLDAFALGFLPQDALALIRLDDIYIETFEIKDVKTLTGDHLSRAIGRIAGKHGRTRFTIENTSRTRIVLADSKIHILGTFSAIRVARDAICALILGSPPGKVYHGLRTVAARQKERF